jgi:hypothetical protein
MENDTIENPEETQKPQESLSVTSLLKKDTSDMCAQVEYQYGIFFHLKFTARNDLMRMMKESTIMRYNPSTKTREPSLDGDKLIRKYCAAAVEGWHGMTPRNLSRLIPMKNVPEEQLDVEIQFSQDQLVELVKNSAEIDTFLQQTATDVNYFNADLEQELKNSKASQNGN